MGRLLLIAGGARSGKSMLAERLIGSADHVTYLATAEPRDAEMAERIRRHRARRPKHWNTIEAPRDADRRLARLAEDPGWILLDCLTLFIANLLEEADDETILRRVSDVGEKVNAGRADVVVVTNEVGMGIVPVPASARRFRDLVGLANQRLARCADEVYFTVAGLAQKLK